MQRLHPAATRLALCPIPALVLLAACQSVRGSSSAAVESHLISVTQVGEVQQARQSVVGEKAPIAVVARETGEPGENRKPSGRETSLENKGRAASPDGTARPKLARVSDPQSAEARRESPDEQAAAERATEENSAEERAAEDDAAQEAPAMRPMLRLCQDGVTFVDGPDPRHPYLRYRDGQISASDSCAVRIGNKLNRRIPPAYVNGRPLGFC